MNNQLQFKTAIQCRDRRTNQVGTFGYREDRELYSTTPVFLDMVGLIGYCKSHDIKLIY